MMRGVRTTVGLALACLVVAPSVIYAQASIAGIAKDTSGAVLPGVTVEVASPALIEKVRSAVTDGAGQYQIVNLRPGSYTLTGTLTGFSTFKRAGIELAGSFAATVNVELRIGTLEETITVAGETPVVDVQSSQQQQILSRDVIAAVPTGRTFLAVATLNPSITLSDQDVGGTSGAVSTRYTTHGSLEVDGRIQQDGIGVGSASGGGPAGTYYKPNVSMSQEQAVTTSAGGLADRDSGGIVVNIIPRDGGNVTSGSVYAAGLPLTSLQSSNYTSALQAQGLAAPSSLTSNWEFTPALGGPIVRDKLWYFISGSRSKVVQTVALFNNLNAGNPKSWTYTPDASQQATFNGSWKSAPALRLTWQATPRNKFTAFWDEQQRCVGCPGASSLAAAVTTAPEALPYGLAWNDRVGQATWTSPLSNRLLLEAGFGDHVLSWGGGENTVFGTQGFIPVTEQAGNVPGLTYRGVNSNFRDSNLTYNTRFAASYITGGHNLKIGYQGSYFNIGIRTFSDAGGLAYRFNNGVPNQLTQTIPDFSQTTFMRDTSVYAQDKWTLKRLTLQGGIRYDAFTAKFPDQQIEASSFVPVRVTFAAGTGSDFKDLSPRLSAAYSLTSDGKTAVNIHLDRYVINQESSTAAGLVQFGAFTNPVSRIASSTTRSWTDTNKNFVPDCNLANPAAQTVVGGDVCGAEANQNFGQSVYSINYDPAITSGWGVRPYDWEFGASVQREVVRRTSVTVGYYRRWYGNFSVTDNLATAASDYTNFQLPVPIDARLPNSGGTLTVPTLNANKFGLVNNLVTAAGNFGKMTDLWQGIDVGVNARPWAGLTAQGGVSSGKRVRDDCPVAAALPEVLLVGATTFPVEYCHADQAMQTQIRALAAFTIPHVDTQISATWQNNPGIALLGVYNVPNAIVAPLLGHSLAGGAANLPLNLVNYMLPTGGANMPVSLQADRLNQIDFRVAKILKFGRTRTLLGIDVFNAMNSSALKAANTTYGPTWPIPTQILQARFLKLSAQFDF